MNQTDSNSSVSIEFHLHWKSDHGTHTDSLYVEKVDLASDLFPKPFLDQLVNRAVGDHIEMSFSPGEIVPKHHTSKLFSLKHSQFDQQFDPDTIILPRQGRFYPKGLLKSVPNVFRSNKELFRCAEIDDSGILVDFNHPLAGTSLTVSAVILDIMNKKRRSGGMMCNAWFETLTSGPGMQIRWNGKPTSFFADDPFARPDENPDAQFYEKPRMVNHIDAKAIETISTLYAQVLRAGDSILDLMSSWTSHLPSGLELGSVTGLGMNFEELTRNERLTHPVIHDLNENPVLPFENGSFDAVICSVSVEYLTQPQAVFREVARVLKPGGCFCLTFSNRWFPPKVIQIWPQLHEFERVGLVSEYFLLSERFKDIHTISVQGHPRPETDKYYGELLVSDPVYAVWAHRC